MEQATYKQVCHPLWPVSLFLNMVSAYLYRKKFISPNLCPPLLPRDTTIRFLDAAYNQKQVTADSTVAYSVNDMTYALTPIGALNTANPMSTITGSITFTVSTASKDLTQELGFELGAFCMAMRPILLGAHCAINSCAVSPTKLDDNSTFFICTATASLSLSYQKWHVDELEGILREVRLTTNLPSQIEIKIN